MSSLCKSSSVRITTKHDDEPSGLRVIYSETGDIVSLEPIELESPGTLVEVRDVHKNNKTYAWKFNDNLRNQYENAVNILTSYSLIMHKTVFLLANGEKPGLPIFNSNEEEGVVRQPDQGKLNTVFSTQAPGCWRKNVDIILTRCFKRIFPRISRHFIDFTIDLCGGAMSIDCICTSPGSGRIGVLAPRCW